MSPTAERASQVYIIFAANAFSLLGLRQLFFLVDGLLDRLVYLNYGLAAILAFIGVKLVIHAMHTNELPWLNGGEHITVIPEPPAWLSLVVIIVVLAITTALSLTVGARRHPHGSVPAGQPSPDATPRTTSTDAEIAQNDSTLR